MRLLGALLSSDGANRRNARLRLTEVLARFTIEPFRHLALRARGYRTPLLKSTIRHQRCRLYLALDGRTVLKRIRCDTIQGIRLRRQLRDPGELQRYRDALRTSHRLPFLGTHFDEVDWVSRDGSCQTQWHQGPVLSELWQLMVSSGSLPEGVSAPALRAALDEFRRNVDSYSAHHEFLVGDWAMHNLIFDTTSETIMNVDTEGLFSNPGLPSTLETSPIYVDRWIESFERLLEVVENRGSIAQGTLEILRLAEDVKRKQDTYNGRLYPTGYHSLNLRGTRFYGQRDCEARLRSVPYDFSGRTVLDLGSAMGGMLLAVADSIGSGVGIERDVAAVRLASSVARFNDWSHLDFRPGDLINQPMDSLAGDVRADIIFLLSLCMWLPNWREMLLWCSEKAPALLLETNGTDEQQIEQENEARLHYRELVLVAEQARDDPGQQRRRLYLCER